MDIQCSTENEHDVVQLLPAPGWRACFWTDETAGRVAYVFAAGRICSDCYDRAERAIYVSNRVLQARRAKQDARKAVRA